MKELGSHHEIGHRQVGEVVAEIGLDHVFLTGGATDLIEDSARAMGYPADRIEALHDLDLDKVADYIRHVPAGDIVLIKGSRALGLEKAIEAVIA
jgi:UDP-N-acetylmuramoyl-tripeptide--D-alanyl-D-alanine ligase